MEIPGSANFKRSAGSTWALEDESPHLDSTCTEGVKRVTLCRGEGPKRAIRRSQNRILIFPLTVFIVSMDLHMRDLHMRKRVHGSTEVTFMDNMYVYAVYTFIIYTEYISWRATIPCFCFGMFWSKNSLRICFALATFLWSHVSERC